MDAMAGKVALVTGATDGLGRETAHRLAAAGATVLVHGRDAKRCADAAAEIRLQSGNPHVRHYRADFSRLTEIQGLLDEISRAEPRLDILLNNAGLGFEHERVLTEDGIERVFQVNYLATYALTIGLTPLLGRSAGARIVCVSSSSQATVDFDDPNMDRGWDPLQAYARSKWAQVAFVMWYARAVKAGGNLEINAVHPGDLMPTKLVRGRFEIRDSIATGVERIVSAVTGAAAPGTTGAYFARGVPARALPTAYDPCVQRSLVDLSERLSSGIETPVSR